MDHTENCGCAEYNELSRRRFLQVSAGTVGGAAALAAMNWVPRIAVAKDYRSGLRDVSVTIFLRGAADALTMVPPFNDANYIAARPTLRIPGPADPSPPAGSVPAVVLPNATTPGGTMFGLAPALAPLLTPYNDGRLLIVHATGSTDPSRSHFDAQRYMEVGKPGDQTLFTGWIGRHLASVTPPINANGLLRGIGFANGLQRALVGAPQTLPIPDPTVYNLTGTGSTVATRKQALTDMYALQADPVHSAAGSALATIDLLNSPQVDFPHYVPQGGAVYPSTGVGASLGKALKSTACLISRQIGLEAVAIDFGGWDFHTNLLPFAGATSMYGYMDALARSIAAFYADLSAQPGAPGYVLTVMSEFGRRLVQNGTLGSGQEGTDHGHGTVMWVMGPAVNGGRVLTNWPGLGPGQLFQNLDLNVTTDYRHILAEIVANRLGNSNLAAVFPGFTPVFQGVLA